MIAGMARAGSNTRRGQSGGVMSVFCVDRHRRWNPGGVACPPEFAIGNACSGACRLKPPSVPFRLLVRSRDKRRQSLPNFIQAQDQKSLPEISMDIGAGRSVPQIRPSTTGLVHLFDRRSGFLATRTGPHSMQCKHQRLQDITAGEVQAPLSAVR